MGWGGGGGGGGGVHANKHLCNFKLQLPAMSLSSGSLFISRGR